MTWPGILVCGHTPIGIAFPDTATSGKGGDVHFAIMKLRGSVQVSLTKLSAQEAPVSTHNRCA